MTSPRIVPRLNRLFTVTASSTITELRPIQWGYNNFNRFLGSPGEWWGRDTDADDFTDGIRASVVAATGQRLVFYPVAVDAEGADDASVPNLADTVSRDDNGSWVRLGKDGVSGYIQWDNPDNIAVLIQGNILVEVNGPGMVVGEDFPIGHTDRVLVSFERRTAEQSVTEDTSVVVWGDMAERGVALGVVDISTGETGQVTTGAQEDGSAIIRYAPGRAIGQQLVDDLGRVWLINGSRTLEDRRYLEYDLTRQVVG